MNSIVGQLLELIKLPVLAVVKTVITLLNLIPTGAWEVHGSRGFSSSNRPDLRSMGSAIRGKRKVHLGTAIIAYTRGALIRVHLNANTKCWGVWDEVFDDIQKKWVW